jgi:hypothetical protein
MRFLPLLGVCLAGIAMPALGQNALPRDAISCRPTEAEHDKVDDVEQRCLAQLKGIASRAGDILTLKLDNGQTKTFRSETKACDEADAEKCLKYWLTAYLPALRAFIIDASAWEAGGVAYVSRRSGAVTMLEEQPQFSPSAQRFAVVKASESEPIDNAIVIYSTATDPPTLEWSYPQPQDYALYKFVGWDGENRIRLSLYTRLTPHDELGEYDADLVRLPQGWMLNRP